MENTLFPLTEHFVPSYKNKVFSLLKQSVQYCELID